MPRHSRSLATFFARRLPWKRPVAVAILLLLTAGAAMAQPARERRVPGQLYRRHHHLPGGWPGARDRLLADPADRQLLARVGTDLHPHRGHPWLRPRAAHGGRVDHHAGRLQRRLRCAHHRRWLTHRLLRRHDHSGINVFAGINYNFATMGNSLYLLEGTDTGAYTIATFSFMSAFVLTAADLNKDGNGDLVIANDVVPPPARSACCWATPTAPSRQPSPMRLPGRARWPW